MYMLRGRKYYTCSNGHWPVLMDNLGKLEFVSASNDGGDGGARTCQDPPPADQLSVFTG